MEVCEPVSGSGSTAAEPLKRIVGTFSSRRVLLGKKMDVMKVEYRRERGGRRDEWRQHHDQAAGCV